MRSLSAQVVSRYDELLVCVIKLVDVKYSAIDPFANVVHSSTILLFSSCCTTSESLGVVASLRHNQQKHLPLRCRCLNHTSILDRGYRTIRVNSLLFIFWRDERIFDIARN